MKKNALFIILVALLTFAGNFLPISGVPAAAATATVTPTRKPAVKIVDFDLNSANRVPPADIINQIMFTGAGGGETCEAINYSSPSLVSPNNTTKELMIESSMETCGWSKNEKLTGSVQYPGGWTRSLSVRKGVSNGINAGIIRFAPGIEDPPGKYTLSISGESGKVTTTVNYRTPPSASLYALDENRLLLYKFSPSEKVRLFYYDGRSLVLKGWQEYTTGSDGRLEVKTSVRVDVDGFFIVVGEKTGEIRLKGQKGIIDKTITLGKKHCSNGLPSRVKVGEKVRAAFTDGSNLRIRVAPGFSETFTTKVPEGTQMTIVGGPRCADNSTWWQVQISGGTKGWVAEYWNGDEYLIEPAP